MCSEEDIVYEEDGQKYIVEKILDKRTSKTRKGTEKHTRSSTKSEYLVQWKDLNESENTWEPEDFIGDHKLVKEFEQKFEKLPVKLRSKRKPTEELFPHEATSSKQPHEAFPSPVGFDRGLEPDDIIGASNTGGRMKFLIKWKDSEESDFVDNEIAKEKCPQLVMKFYERRLIWRYVGPVKKLDESTNTEPNIDAKSLVL